MNVWQAFQRTRWPACVSRPGRVVKGEGLFCSAPAVGVPGLLGTPPPVGVQGAAGLSLGGGGDRKG